MQSELLSWRACAAVLGLSRSTLEKLIRDENSGVPKPFKIGAKRFFAREDVIAFIARKRAEVGRH
jgi:excisionase family DNA binding protein